MWDHRRVVRRDGRGRPLLICPGRVIWRSRVAFREVHVIEIREVLRAWLADAGLRTAAERAGVDRKTARRYVVAAREAGLVRDGGEAQLTDELIGAVVAAVRPARMSGHGASWETLLGEEERIRAWVDEGVAVDERSRQALSPRGGGAVPDVAPVRDPALRVRPVEEHGAGR